MLKKLLFYAVLCFSTHGVSVINFESTNNFAKILYNNLNYISYSDKSKLPKSQWMQVDQDLLQLLAEANLTVNNISFVKKFEIENQVIYLVDKFLISGNPITMNTILDIIEKYHESNPVSINEKAQLLLDTQRAFFEKYQLPPLEWKINKVGIFTKIGNEIVFIIYDTVFVIEKNSAFPYIVQEFSLVEMKDKKTQSVANFFATMCVMINAGHKISFNVSQNIYYLSTTISMKIISPDGTVMQLDFTSRRVHLRGAFLLLKLVENESQINCPDELLYKMIESALRTGSFVEFIGLFTDYESKLPFVVQKFIQLYCEKIDTGNLPFGFKFVLMLLLLSSEDIRISNCSKKILASLSIEQLQENLNGITTDTMQLEKGQFSSEEQENVVSVLKNLTIKFELPGLDKNKSSEAEKFLRNLIKTNSDEITLFPNSNLEEDGYFISERYFEIQYLKKINYSFVEYCVIFLEINKILCYLYRNNLFFLLPNGRLMCFNIEWQLRIQVFRLENGEWIKDGEMFEITDLKAALRYFHQAFCLCRMFELD